MNPTHLLTLAQLDDLDHKDFKFAGEEFAEAAVKLVFYVPLKNAKEALVDLVVLKHSPKAIDLGLRYLNAKPYCKPEARDGTQPIGFEGPVPPVGDAPAMPPCQHEVELPPESDDQCPATEACGQPSICEEKPHRCLAHADVYMADFPEEVLSQTWFDAWLDATKLAAGVEAFDASPESLRERNARIVESFGRVPGRVIMSLDGGEPFDLEEDPAARLAQVAEIAARIRHAPEQPTLSFGRPELPFSEEPQSLDEAEAEGVAATAEEPEEGDGKVVALRTEDTVITRKRGRKKKDAAPAAEEAGAPA